MEGRISTEAYLIEQLMQKDKTIKELTLKIQILEEQLKNQERPRKVRKSDRRDDLEHEIRQIIGHIVFIQGLSYDKESKEMSAYIVDRLGPFGRIHQIYIEPSHDGFLSGKAYVIFANRLDREKCLQNREMLGQKEKWVVKAPRVERMSMRALEHIRPPGQGNNRRNP